MKLSAIAALYMASPAWLDLSQGSRLVYERAMTTLEPLLKLDADKITRPMIVDFRDKHYAQGGVCRAAISTLNNILGYGYDRGLCIHNHAAAMKHMPKMINRPRWTEEELETFEKGAKAYVRSVFLLALYTGQRRSDLFQLKWDQYDGEAIRLRQQKTIKTNPSILYLPVHPLLKVELERLKAVERKKKHPFILSNCYGDPWTKPAMTEAITDTAEKLGIYGKTIHGLRKTTAAKLAEIGCPPHLIAAITGHKTLKEIMNYTAEADQIRMAKEAMGRWVADGSLQEAR